MESKKYTTDNIYNGKQIQIREGAQADCKLLDAIGQSICQAMEKGSDMMIIYDVSLPSEYNQSAERSNCVFQKVQADICKYQKRSDKSDSAPRYIAVRDGMSQEAPLYKVAMFLPNGTKYNKVSFENKATEITNGKIQDWSAFRDHDLMRVHGERYGVKVLDAVRLDETESMDDALYAASELASVKPQPKAARTLFRSQK